MEIFVPVLMMPVLMVMTWRVILTPFGWFRLVPLAIALAGSAKLRHKYPFAGPGFSLWVFLAYVLDLFAWLASKRSIAAGSSTADWSGFPSAYMAGFPVHLLQLPPPPMGGDLPPVWEWWVVIVNLIFWSMAAGAIVLTVHQILNRMRRLDPRSFGRADLWLWVGALLVNQATCTLFFLWFD